MVLVIEFVYALVEGTNFCNFVGYLSLKRLENSYFGQNGWKRVEKNTVVLFSWRER